MNPVVILLAFATFVTGTAENIIVGILPDVAGGLGVSLALAGQLTAVFSIVFAVTAPLALVLTKRIDRRRLFLAALGLFMLSTFAAAASPNFAIMLLTRIGMAAASATVCLLATMLATELVDESMQGRAIGIMFMGISGSLVLGVPAGILIADVTGWRGVFLALAALAFTVWLVSWRCIPASGPRGVALPGYLKHLRSARLVAGQLVSIFMIGGHFVLFAFLVEVAGIADGNVALGFAALGIAGISGGYFGGWLADRLSPRAALLLTPSAYLAALAGLPLLKGSPGPLFAVMMVWACISWMISPVVQRFLISTGPETAEAGISLNFSAMHVGVGLGTIVGGFLVRYDIAALPVGAAVIPALALITAAVAFRAAGAVHTRKSSGTGDADRTLAKANRVA
ncbi:MFS transporter (plasmid) [Ensifer sp. PDNC004]|uniref:MFS transporter n=1 Tax=Ensifer sp. PDNC004 TaxID=2811423 RepID=UPI0019634C1A|nr:MFS transporter [Ensifer sp. PDNC004]QRY70700.1 MFS transporter [Ensifer sp. PDNC004]